MITQRSPLSLVITLFFVVSVETQFRQYFTRYRTHHDDHMCIYRYANEARGRSRQLVPYCIRSPTRTAPEQRLSCHGENMTFAELKRAHITAYQLMEWLAPVDLISDYQEFLDGRAGEENLFCNCSRADYSFGTRCQYQFSVVYTSSFEQIVTTSLTAKSVMRDIRNLTAEEDVTCYILQNCTTYTNFCLDWRQVCDSRRDCANGDDEEQCMELELNECDPVTEYRCRGGHCIPRSFSFDLTADCPEWDDEQSLSEIRFFIKCNRSVSADCEERHCGLSEFSCGDGQCFGFIHFAAEDPCNSQRDALLVRQLYVPRIHLSEECWRYLICHTGLSCLYELPTVLNSSCRNNGAGTAQFCSELNNHSISCPQDINPFFPVPSIAFPSVQLLYNVSLSPPLLPRMICHNASVHEIKPWGVRYVSEVVRNYHCYSNWAFTVGEYLSMNLGVKLGVMALLSLQKIFSYRDPTPNVAKLYRCASGLQIFPNRLYDYNFDCYPDKGDETKGNVTCAYNITDRFECSTVSSRRRVCIPRRFLHDGVISCEDELDEHFPVGCTNEFDCHYLRQFDLTKPLPVVYEEFCNGYNLLRKFGVTEDDEKDCDRWPCRARVHRCDGIWNRPNGCDEVDCPNLISSYISEVVGNCSSNEHYCLRFNASAINCLSLTRAGDGRSDCLFAMDERKTGALDYLRCRNSTKISVDMKDLCDRSSKCPLHDDELLCPWHSNSSCTSNEFTCKNGTCISVMQRCNRRIDCWPDAEDEWACDLGNRHIPTVYRRFTLTNFDTEPSEEQSQSIPDLSNDQSHFTDRSSTVTHPDDLYRCHRGLLLRSKDGLDACLCPPSYHGDRCQFQSERLTITFRTVMPYNIDLNRIYHLVFLLLDHNQKVLASETMLHMPAEESVLKHLIYLIYPRWSNQSRYEQLFVRVEAYPVTDAQVEPLSLAWAYYVQHSFLPVNRLALKLDLEARSLSKPLCRQLGCVNGVCSSYRNMNKSYFCLCNPGWSGPTCNQSVGLDPCLQLNCDPTRSKCVRYDNNYAVCLCTLGRIGHTCRVPYDACRDVRCENGGRCVSLDERTLQKVCLCSSDYFGRVCQFRVARVTLQVSLDAQRIPAALVHFSHTPATMPGVLSHRSTHFVADLHTGMEITIRDSHQQFLPSIIMVQTFADLSSQYGSYYLLALIADNRTSLVKSLVPTSRCLHVSERLHPAVMDFPWNKRVKFYHHYFEDARCFFDESYMCFVDREQLIECLVFDHDVASCTERNYCQNGGRCLQNQQNGRLQFACICPECHYGAFCQLSMTQYSLTLDVMLAPIIVTDASLSEQPSLVKVTLAIVIVMFIIGMASNLCSAVTFSDADVRKTSCGLYLLILSIVSQLALVLFVYRFAFLLVSQMNVIPSREFLRVSCMSLEFVLQLSISFCDWLAACVACDRTMRVVKGVNFDKVLSVRTMKFVLVVLFVCLVLTGVHQVSIRELTDDPHSEDRFWCMVKFPSAWLRSYTAAMNLGNICVPFLANFASVVILLVTFSRMKQKSKKGTETLWSVLKSQFRAHRHLLISPMLMIVFKLPLVILVLSSKCIKSEWQLHLAVSFYLLALLPVIATFLIFVLFSPPYLKTFRSRHRDLFQQRAIPPRLVSSNTVQLQT